MTDNRTFVNLDGISERNRPAVMHACYLALLNAGGEDGDWIEIASELATRPFFEVLTEYFTFSEAATFPEPKPRWEIRDWMNNLLFDGKTFDTFEDAWGHIYEHVEDDDNAYDDFYVVPNSYRSSLPTREKV